jgi:phosphomevalonate kinase
MKYVLFYYLAVMKTYCIQEYWVLFTDLQIIYKTLYSFEIKKSNFNFLKIKIESFKKNFENLLGKENCTSNFHLIVCFIYLFI